MAPIVFVRDLVSHPRHRNHLSNQLSSFFPVPTKLSNIHGHAFKNGITMDHSNHFFFSPPLSFQSLWVCQSFFFFFFLFFFLPVPRKFKPFATSVVPFSTVGSYGASPKTIRFHVVVFCVILLFLCMRVWIPFQTATTTLVPWPPRHLHSSETATIDQQQRHQLLCPG